MSPPIYVMRRWFDHAVAWLGFVVLLAVLVALWCLPALVWIEVFHGGPRKAAYLTLAIIVALTVLIAIVGTQWKRISRLARGPRLPQIPEGPGFHRHAPT